MAMSDVQEQARALGDPTRFKVFRYLADADQPVDVAELTAHFAFNHNAIRQHLAKLVAAGLVREAKAPARGPGRPRLLYSIDPAAGGTWGVAGPYERLAMLLTEIIRTGDSPLDVGRRAGHRQRRQVSDVPGDAADQLTEMMSRQGFDPQLRRRGNHAELVLHTCPFASAALSDPDTVCTLHLGMAEGFAAPTGTLAIDELVAKDPRRALCRLRLDTSPPDPEPEPTLTLTRRPRKTAARRAI
jgi:predicted ArsR family transcriptional regulator